MNQVALLGRLTKDIKTNQSGKVGFATLAVQSSEKDDNGKYKARFIPIRFLGEKTVDSVKKYLSKGTQIGVTGELVVDDVKDDDGNYKTYAYVIVRSWEFAQSKKDSEKKQEKQEDDASEFVNIPEGLDTELPFS